MLAFWRPVAEAVRVRLKSYETIFLSARLQSRTGHMGPVCCPLLGVAAAVLFVATQSTRASECNRPVAALTETNIVTETAVNKQLFTIGAEANSNWTIEHEQDTPPPGVPLTEDREGLLQFWKEAVGFTGGTSSHVCSGPATCPVTILNAIDHELLRDRYKYILRGQIRYRLSCTLTGANVNPNARGPFVATFLVISRAVVEFPPEFNGSTTIFVRENTAVGTTVVTFESMIVQKDVKPPALTFRLHPFSGHPWFDMNNTMRGIVNVYSSLNFEVMDLAVINLTLTVASAFHHLNVSLKFNILDVDDKPPVFPSLSCSAGKLCSKFHLTIPASFTGIVKTIEPGGCIQAEDGDSLGFPVTYRIKSGPDHPPFGEYMYLDAGAVAGGCADFIILQPLRIYDPPTELTLTIEATEESNASRSSTALLGVKVTVADDDTPVQSRTIQILAGTLVPVSMAILFLAAYTAYNRRRRAEERQERDGAGQSSGLRQSLASVSQAPPNQLGSVPQAPPNQDVELDMESSADSDFAASDASFSVVSEKSEMDRS